MDADEARQRLLNGGYFIALGVPPGVDFGIDCKTYKTGPHFKGVKMIPAGLHFVHYGTGEGEKQGFFFRSMAGTVAATKWEPSSEDLMEAGACLPEGSIRSLMEAVIRLEMDSNLGPYPFEQATSWSNLTNCISEAVLQRCEVPCGTKVLAGSASTEEVVQDMDWVGDLKDGRVVERGMDMREVAGQVGGGGAGDKVVVPRLPHLGRLARFSRVPGVEKLGVGRGKGGEVSFRTPEELTRVHLDKTLGLRELLRRDFGGAWTELLGELQLSFVLFICLASLHGFHQWQQLCALLCCCEEALKTDPALFTAFVRVLHSHLKLVPEDFFDVDISKDNFLVTCLSALFQNVLMDSALDMQLRDAVKRLVKFVQLRFRCFAHAGRSSNTAHGRRRRRLQSQRQGEGVEGEDQSSSDGDENMDAMRHEGEEVLYDHLLELSEEDMPVVVPFQEVSRALGGIGPSDPMDDVKEGGGTERQGVRDDGVAQGVAGMGESQGKKQGHGAKAVRSAGHLDRWHEIDRCLKEVKLEGVGVGTRRAGRDPALVQPSSPPLSKFSPSGVEFDGRTTVARMSNGGALAEGSVSVISGGKLPGGRKAAHVEDMARRGSYAGELSRRYPSLFSAVQEGEDVMMTAARLVSEEEGDVGIGYLEMQEAVSFLEEVGGREDGGCAVWQVIE